MNAHYAEIFRVETWRQIVNKFRFFNVFKIFPILLWNINNFNSAKKKKKKKKTIFLDKNSKKSLYCRICIGQTNFWP